MIDLQSCFHTGWILGFLVPNWPLAVEQDLWPLTVSICLLRIQLKPDTVLPTTTGGWLLLRQKWGESTVTLGTEQRWKRPFSLITVSALPLSMIAVGPWLRSAEPCVCVVVNTWCTIWHLLHFLIRIYLCWRELWPVCVWDIAELLILSCTACCRLVGYLH